MKKYPITGKAEEDFFEWLENNHRQSDWDEYKGWYKNPMKSDFFYSLPQSAQQGLVMEWADSVGYFTEIIFIAHEWAIRIFNIRMACIVSENDFNSRPEAQIKVVEKLSEIYNKLKQ